MTADFELNGLQFTALNGGPLFKFNEAVSIEVHCDTQGADVRLAEGQVRRFLAGRPQHDGRFAEGRELGEVTAGVRRDDENEEARHRRIEESVRGEIGPVIRK